MIIWNKSNPMTFASIEYIFFLLGVFLFNWVFCNKSKTLQNVCLLMASYAFYAFFDWKCALLLFATSFSVYLAGLYFKKKGSSKLVCSSVIALNLAILGFFKYCNFFLQTISDINGGGYEPLNIIVPVGISFYTFSAISYVVDTYKGKIAPTEDVVECLLYTSFFPAILSGPIHKATVQLPQYQKKREFDYLLVTDGFKNFLWGAFMKLCVADKLGVYVDAVYGNIPNHNGTTLLFTSIIYTFQIYADFAGYSLMAIGSGKILGIRLQTNFLRPYFAKTITEFWSKWHISLTSWFRNYVYFPLGGNRVNRARWIFNIMSVFLLSGFWHGAAYTFIIWGAIHGFAQVVEKLLYGKKIKEMPKGHTIANIIRTVITFSIVSFAWIFFRLPSISDVCLVFEKIVTEQDAIFMDPMVYIGFVSLIIMVLKDMIDQKQWDLHLLNNQSKAVRIISCVGLVVYILLFGQLDGSSFIYFQF